MFRVLMIAAWGGSATPALAGDWPSFESAFPMFPCQDGWMACEVKKQHIDPDLHPDDEGRQLTSDMRIGWFDLAPSATFSPFPGLTAYALPERVSPTPVEPPPPVLLPPHPHGSKAPTKSTNPLGTDEPHPEVPPVRPVPVLAPPPGPNGNGGEAGPDEGSHSKPPTVPQGAQGMGSIDCRDTVPLEPQALLGKLDASTLACLETNLANAPRMTDKRKISALELVDAWAKGDKARWETLIKRHLDEIDQSDPDLCYKYALHLSRQGIGRAPGVIHWANVALENRTVWVGETYTSRVYSLYKVRSAASQSLWQDAEEAHARAPSDQTREHVDEYRTLTKVSAREWYDYAKSSGKDSETALELCISAAGTSEYCQ